MATGSRQPGTLEVTLEANPSDLDEARLEGFLHAGVNRLSIGFQVWLELFRLKVAQMQTLMKFYWQFTLALA